MDSRPGNLLAMASLSSSARISGAAFVARATLETTFDRFPRRDGTDGQGRDGALGVDGGTDLRDRKEKTFHRVRLHVEVIENKVERARVFLLHGAGWDGDRSARELEEIFDRRAGGNDQRDHISTQNGQGLSIDWRRDVAAHERDVDLVVFQRLGTRPQIGHRHRFKTDARMRRRRHADEGGNEALRYSAGGSGGDAQGGLRRPEI